MFADGDAALCAGSGSGAACSNAEVWEQGAPAARHAVRLGPTADGRFGEGWAQDALALRIPRVSHAGGSLLSAARKKSHPRVAFFLLLAERVSA